MSLQSFDLMNTDQPWAACAVGMRSAAGLLTTQLCIERSSKHYFTAMLSHAASLLLVGVDFVRISVCEGAHERTHDVRPRALMKQCSTLIKRSLTAHCNRC